MKLTDEEQCPDCKGQGYTISHHSVYSMSVGEEEHHFCWKCKGTGKISKFLSQSTPEGLEGKIKELNLHYLTLCKKRDDYSPAMVEPELTNGILPLIASECLQVRKEMIDWVENHKQIGVNRFSIDNDEWDDYLESLKAEADHE